MNFLAVITYSMCDVCEMSVSSPPYDLWWRMRAYTTTHKSQCGTCWHTTLRTHDLYLLRWHWKNVPNKNNVGLLTSVTVLIKVNVMLKCVVL